MGRITSRVTRSAGSFSASPSANPAGRRKRLIHRCRGSTRCCFFGCLICPSRPRPRRTSPRHGWRRSSRSPRRSSRPARRRRCCPTARPPPRPRPRRRSRPRSSPPTSCSTSRTSTAAATPRSRTRATTAPAPSPTRCSAPALLKSPLDSSSLHALGPQGQGHLDHGLHEPGPRLRRHRRPAAGHVSTGVHRPSRKIARTAERGPRWRVGKRRKRAASRSATRSGF